MARAGTAPKDLISRAKAGDFQSVYALDGPEQMLVREALSVLIEASVPKSARDFNLDRLSGKGLSGSKVVEAANLLPAFAERRVVVVREADKMRAEEQEVLLSYLERPSLSTVLVLVGEKFDARTKFYKKLKKDGSALRFESPKPREMPAELSKRAQSIGLVLSSAALRALAEAVGSDLSRGVKALDMLALYMGPAGGEVSVEIVAEVVPVTKEESVFQLSDALGRKDKATALRILHQILRISREHPLRVLAVIGRHYRNLTVAKGALLLRKPHSEIQREVSVPPFLLPNLLAQAEKNSLSGLARGLKKIAETDRLLKGGGLQGQRAMESLLLSLMEG